MENTLYTIAMILHTYAPQTYRRPIEGEIREIKDIFALMLQGATEALPKERFSGTYSVIIINEKHRMIFDVAYSEHGARIEVYNILFLMGSVPVVTLGYIPEQLLPQLSIHDDAVLYFSRNPSHLIFLNDVLTFDTLFEYFPRPMQDMILMLNLC